MIFIGYDEELLILFMARFIKKNLSNFALEGTNTVTLILFDFSLNDIILYHSIIN